LGGVAALRALYGQEARSRRPGPKLLRSLGSGSSAFMRGCLAAVVGAGPRVCGCWRRERSSGGPRAASTTSRCAGSSTGSLHHRAHFHMYCISFSMLHTC
jgi:hypothetical protein